SVDGRPDAGDEDGGEQRDGDREQREGEHAVAVIVDARGDEHADEAERRPQRLPSEEVAGIVERVERLDPARAVDHGDPQQGEREDHDEQDEVVRRRARHPGQAEQPHECTGSVNERTSAVKRSPRSSAEENMSNDAHAGDGRTTSPERASRRDAATASSSVRARSTGNPARAAPAASSAPAISSAEAPIRTAARVRVTTTRASSPKSAPFPTPPRITTAGRSNASIALIVASGVVEAESLTQRTPSLSATVSRRRATPSNARSSAPMTSGAMSKTSPTIAAASAFAMLWRPGMRSSFAAMIGVLRSPSVNTRRPSESRK